MAVRGQQRCWKPRPCRPRFSDRRRLLDRLRRKAEPERTTRNCLGTEAALSAEANNLHRLDQRATSVKRDSRITVILISPG